MRYFAIVILVASTVGVGAADPLASRESEVAPEAPEARPDPSAEEPAPSSESVRGAPRPGSESGRLDEVDPGDGAGRKVGRAGMWLFRIPIEVIAMPIRGAAYVNDRYDAVRRITEVFVTDDRKIALYPMALLETGFGLNVGMRGYVKDMLGAKERLKVRAGFGGEARWNAEAGIDSGKLLPEPLSASLDVSWTERDKERFFGYGNADMVTPPETPIDPLAGDTAVASRFRVRVARAVARLRVQLPAHLSVTGTSALVKKQFEAGTPIAGEPAIDEAYMIDQVPGFTDGTRYTYNELEVAYDTRRQADPWDAPGMFGTGGLAMMYGGLQHDLDGKPSFVRTGIDLQRVVRITSRPRVLQFRFWGEAVTGARDEVPFSELPRLGGEQLLRGHTTDRFRDRVATVAQASYSWAAANWLAPVLFVDVGRVHTGLDSLSIADPHVGFGGALEIYSARGLTMRAEIATSLDGGLFGYIALNPWYGARARVERY